MNAKIRIVGTVATQLFAIEHGMREDFRNAGGQVRQFFKEHIAGRARPGIDEMVIEYDATGRGALRPSEIVPDPAAPIAPA